MINELIGRVFTARDLAHIEHLSTTSYAAHMALGDFYDEIITAVDAIAESWQGKFGKLEKVSFPEQPEIEDFAEYLRQESDWIEANREEIANGSSAIGNLVDNLVNVYDKTVYKLERFE